MTSKVKGCCGSTKNLFKEYAEHSTVHGVSYITESGRSWIEKCWWITVFGVSVFICGKLIFNAANISPIIISVAEKPTPIWQIPFPAVTICPSSVAEWSLTTINAKGEQYFQNLTDNEKLQTLAKNAFCSGRFLDSLQNFSNCNECLRAIREILVPLEEIFVECKFMSQSLNCTEVLEETVVGSKICYTFNGHGLYRQIDDDDDDDHREFRRTISAGPQYGLSILLRSDRKYLDLYCSDFDGFLIEYRMPYESPQFKTNYFTLRMEKSLNLVIHPKMIVTSNELQGYSLGQRKCYFDNERRLQYFRKYTQSNCEIECEIKEILEYCDHLPVFIENQNGIDIIGPNQSWCASSVISYVGYQNYRQCKCLPTCTSTAFDSEIQVARLNTSRFFNGSREESVKFSRLNIYFKENQFIASKRTELYGRTDFFANCGGLMALCLGMSVLSILEIVYFFTVRLWITVRSRHQGRSDTGDEWQREGAPKPKRSLKIFENVIAEYFAKSTLQGIRYAGLQTLSNTERIWWAFLIGVSFFSCGCLIYKVLWRYDQSPVIISYANEETTISDIPFPAVTICPQVIWFPVESVNYYFRVENQSLYTLNPRLIDYIVAVAQVCEPYLFDDTDPENRTVCENCAKNLLALAISPARYVMKCNHIFRPRRCSDMFDMVVTESGVCLVYNALQPYRDFTNGSNSDITDNWTIDGGYRNNSGNVDVHPRSGSKIPLTLLLGVMRSYEDYLCKGAIQGFKVYLHMPNEAPQISKHFYLLPYQHLTQILINPRMTVTSPELRAVPVAKRQCYFSDERYLRFFRFYTQNNCEIECLANLTMRRCGCLMFYLPKVKNVKVCAISDMRCQQTMFQLELEQKINQEDSLGGCHCLPGCTSITYDTEVNHMSYSAEAVETRFGKQFAKEAFFAEMRMIFRENQFVALKRSQLFGKTEIMANCGGLLNLFLGFSVISILELFYFGVIRLLSEVKKKFM